jgi:NADH dehydrogenase
MGNTKRVVIVGGGFGGVQCARALRPQLPAESCEIVLFNRENHMVFHPLLPEVAGASLNPDAVAAPFRQMLNGVLCRTETVRAIDLGRRLVEFDAHDGHTGTLSYDHLVRYTLRHRNQAMKPEMRRPRISATALRPAIAQKTPRNL